MLSRLVLSLLAALGHSFFALGANARGVVCIEAKQPEHDLPYRISPPQSQDLSANRSLHDASGIPLRAHAYRLPITVFLDDNLQLEPKQEPLLNPYIWRFFDPNFKSASLVFAALNGMPYPSTSASTRRISGEIRKLITQHIEPSLAGVEGAEFRRWLFPSKALFQYQAPHVVDGSGDWLFRHASYRSWICSDQDNLLWITGKPGSGKSTLVKLLSDSIRHEDAIYLEEPAIAASVIFDFRYVLERENGGAKGQILRALLYQILESSPTLSPGLCQALSPLSPLPDRPEDLDVHCYQLCLEAALSAATDKATVFLLIDGLDECGSKVQDDVMACLAPIYQQPQFTKKVRIMITSRWGSSMHRRQQQRHSGIKWLEMENTEDITTFCSAMLSPRQISQGITTDQPDSCVHWKDSVQELVDSIITRADGVFLWVKLVVDLLLTDYPAQQHSGCGTKRWQQAVQELPTGLESLYENLVHRVPAQLKSASDLVFMWCSLAVRPLNVLELQSAIGSHTDELKPKVAAVDFTSQLRRMTYGLVEVVSDPGSYTDTVQLLHSSVRDFLMGATSHLAVSQTSLAYGSVGLIHTLMAETCFRYIMQISCSGNSTTHPFLDYSVSHWSFHARTGEQLAVSQDYLIEIFRRPSSKSVSFWLEEYEGVRSPQTSSAKSVPLPHVAAHHGLISTLKAMSLRDPAEVTWDLKDCMGRTALHHAAAQGHSDVVRLLLDHGASIDVEDTQMITPLRTASQKGQTSVVEHLLALDENKTSDVAGRTAIHHAARAGHTEVVKILIDKGADLDAQDLRGHSALTLAAASGNEDLACFLLKLNDSRWSAAMIGVALTFAAALNLKTLTRSLLRSERLSGPDDVFVQQAFIASIISGSQELVLLFLELGCHPDLHDYRYGQSALSIAAAGGDDRIVRILLEHGAHPNIQDIRTGLTPVMHAISRGFPVVVQLLLEFGAELKVSEKCDDQREDGWISKIILALIHQCPSGNNGGSNKRTSTNSSTESVAGSSTHGHKSQSTSGKRTKRCRPKQEAGGNEDGSDDEGTAKKKSRHDKESDAQLMCPFHRRYPNQHNCPPFPRVSRLKEHIHRKHHKVFCVHCWKIFKDEAAVAVHHKTEECVERNRTDFSGGICKTQANNLKSRTGIQGMSEKDHWTKVFSIVFPDFEGRPPSPYYYNTSNTFVEALQQMLRDPCLRQGLEPRLGGGQWEAVRDLILAFAGNQRVAPSDEAPSEVLRIGFPHSLRNFTNVGGNGQQLLAAPLPPGNNAGFQGPMPMSPNFARNEPWNLMYEAPILQHPFSQPPFSHVASDSGVGSMIMEPQGRDLYTYDGMGADGMGADGVGADGTASSGELGQNQAAPYFQSTDSMYLSPENDWNTGEEQR